MRLFTYVSRLIVLFLLISHGVSSQASGVECAALFKEIPLMLKLEDNSGCCRMETAPSYGEYPPESIPYTLRNGREVCSCRGDGRVDREFAWKQGQRISGTFYGSHVYGSSGVVTKSEFLGAVTVAGPIRVFQNEKLFCEIPITEKGKVTGIVKEYHPGGRLAWQARVAEGKVNGASPPSK